MSTERIRELNDSFRSTFGGGKVMITPGVYELPDCVKADALMKVATFADFRARAGDAGSNRKKPSATAIIQQSVRGTEK